MSNRAGSRYSPHLSGKGGVMTTLIVEVPWPPTGNHAYTVAHGRKILSSAGRKYRDATAMLIAYAARGQKFTGRLSLTIDAYPPDARVRDLDNIAKGPIDCLKRAGVIADDGDIDALRIYRRGQRKGGLLSITIATCSLPSVGERNC